MLPYINSLKTYFKSLNKFQWGQLLFILSWCPGVFLHDTVRKILIVAALCCLSKDKIRESFEFVKTKVPRILPIMLIAFWCWIIFIPLFFGVENFAERLRDLGWPIEMLVFMFAAFVYAKDEFFLKSFKKIFMVSITFFLISTLAHRATLHFITNYLNWILGGSAYNIGCILTWVLPVIVFYIFNKQNVIHTVSIFFIICFALLVIMLTMYTQFWAASLVELAIILLTILCVSLKDFKKFIVGFFMILLLFCSSCFILTYEFPPIRPVLSSQITQIMSYNKGMEEFTNQRYHIWLEGIKWIKKRPLTGYGWEDFAKYSVEKREHTHSAWTQAAWVAGIPAVILFVSLIFTNSLYAFILMLKRKKLLFLPFVLLVAMAGYCTIGCLDDVFRATRRVTFPYWIILTLPLTPLFYTNSEKRQGGSAYE